jgi:methylisocitrate lyase
VPILANMTEFGRSELLSAAPLEELGIDLVLYPVTTQRLAMGAVERGLRVLRDEGTQAGLPAEMQDRRRLYDLLGYERYGAWDERVADLGLPDA